MSGSKQLTGSNHILGPAIQRRDFHELIQSKEHFVDFLPEDLAEQKHSLSPAATKRCQENRS
jgi:hypothetical protein